MKIGLIGATGNAGSLILEEALRRNLDVTAIVRSKNKLTVDVPVIEKAIETLQKEDIEAFDVLINAFNAPKAEDHLHEVRGKQLIDLVTGTNTRLIVVGGAGSLFVNPEKTMCFMDLPIVPDFVKPAARSSAKNLEDLRASSINWTYISPSAMFDPTGTRTGTYTIGEDTLLTNSTNESYISMAGYAIALIDEVGTPAHMNKRFTVVAEKA